MKEVLLAPFHSAAGIESYYRDHIATRDIRVRRQSVGICVIDDQPFAPQANLGNYGYRIQPLGDIKTVSEIEPYDLVLCDIMGVGQHFDTRLQGASIIAEMKRCHPEKFIVAYTGAALNQVAAREAAVGADDILKKDVDIEEWISVLDGYTAAVLDPKQVWERIRADLVQREIDTKHVLRLEDAYVASVLRRDKSFVALRGVLGNLSLGEDVRAIVNGIISSAAFKFILGS